MALIYPDDPVEVSDGDEVEYLTVRNQFTEDGVEFSIDPSVETDPGLSADVSARDVVLDAGEESEQTVRFDCDSETSGEQHATVSFDVTADGEGVHAATTAERTVPFDVDCGDAIGVSFRGQSPIAHIENGNLDGTGATVSVLDSGSIFEQSENVENGKVNASAGWVIAAVYLDATNKTYVSPKLEWTNSSFDIGNPGTGSNEPTDRVCSGYVDLSTKNEVPCLP